MDEISRPLAFARPTVCARHTSWAHAHGVRACAPQIGSAWLYRARERQGSREMQPCRKAALQAMVVDGSCHLRVTRSLARGGCQHRCCIEWRPADASTTPSGRLCLGATTVSAAFHMCAAAFLIHVWSKTGVTRPAVLDAARFDSSVDLAAIARLMGSPGSRARGANCEFTVRAALVPMKAESDPEGAVRA
jgi:hypothetical protein